MPTATLLVARNGGGPASGNVVCLPGDVIQLSAVSTVGWGSPAAEWRMYGFPVGFALPAGWSSKSVAQPNGGTVTVYYYLGNSPNPPSFTLPNLASGIWGGWGLGLYVNGATPANVGSALVDESTCLNVYSPSGYEDIFNRETTQTSGLGWVAPYQKNLRISEAMFAATSGVAVASIAALGNVLDASLTDGSAVWVATKRDDYELHKTSGLTADGQNIVTAHSGGLARWHAKGLPDIFWASQPTWFKSAAGNDENSGVDAGHPVKTYAEILRRVGTLRPNQYTKVTLSADTLTAADPVLIPPLGPLGVWHIVGTRSAVYANNAGGFTTVTNLNRATQTLPRVKDTALSDTWQNLGYNGASSIYRIRTTTGASAGAIAWGIGETGVAKETFVSAWTIPVTGAGMASSFAEVNVAATDRFAIESVTQVTSARIKVDVPAASPSQVRVILEDLYFNTTETLQIDGPSAFSVAVVGCNTVSATVGNCAASLNASKFGTLAISGNSAAFSCYVSGKLSVTSGAPAIDGDTIAYGGGIRVSDGAFPLIGNVASFSNTGNGVDVFGTARVTGTLWGTGNTAGGASVAPGGRIEYPAGNKPTVVGADELYVCSVVLHWADVPYTDGPRGAYVREHP